MQNGRQALQFCLYTAIVVIIKIFNEFVDKMFNRIKVLQIEEFTLEQTKEIFYHSIIQAVALTAHALANTLGLQHLLVVLVLIL